MWLTALVSLIASFFIVPTAAAVPTSDDPGNWTVVANCNVNPIHAALLDSGKVLMMAGSGYNNDNFLMKINQAWIYDPSTPNVCPVEIQLPEGVDLFCAGMTHLPDGRILVFGGTGRYGVQGSNPVNTDKPYYSGIKDAYVFDENGNTFTKVADMGVARWYGTGTIILDGRIVTYGGLDENSHPTKNHQIFNPETLTWANLITPTFAMPMYAGTAVLPTGWFLYSGTNFGNATYDVPGPVVWSPFNGQKTAVPGLYAPQCRDQSNTIVVYPKVYVIAGGCTFYDGVTKNGLTGTVYSLDMTKQPYKFVAEPYAMAGMHQCAVGMPDQSIFLSHGDDHNKKDTATLRAMRLEKNGTAWQELAAPSVPRGYHSTCMILKDGRVLTMGTDWNSSGDVETRLEIYNPWYTQPGFVRPRIADLGTAETCGVSELVPGTTLHAKTEVASIVGGTLTKIPSVTHQHDPNNRVVPITVKQTSFGNVDITVPQTSPTTPKGEYMLSLLDWRGAPTISKMVNLGSSTHCCCC